QLYFFPRVTGAYFEQIYTAGNFQVDIGIKNAEIYAYRPSLETYEATIKPSGNLDTIILTASSIRAGFGAYVVGKQIYASYDYDQESDTITVTAYDAVNKILTLQRNINLASATLDDTGWIGLNWEESQNTDTISVYEAYWLIDNTGMSFISSIPTPASTKTNFEFHNITSDGFYDFMFKSNGAGRVLFDKCDLSAHVSIVTNFQNSAVYSETIVTNSFIHDTGFESKGQNPGNSQANGDRYNGGTIYTHPNTKLFVQGCRFDNAGVAIRQYSSTGDKPLTDYKFHSEINNSEFINQRDQYHVFTSHQIRTKINNSYFHGGGVWTRNNTEITGCVFDSTVIDLNTLNNE